MKAMKIVDAGQHGTLQAIDLPMPQPAAGEIRIRTAYAGVNRADIFQRQGRYPAPDGASPVPGLEVSGVVDAVGEGVTMYKTGDEVCALISGGGYAQYCIAPAQQVLPLPIGWNLREAAALPEALATGWLVLIDKAQLQCGERVLIHGGASGVGVMAIQLAALHGAEVFATAGTEEKCAAIARLGARAIHYRTQDFSDGIMQETQSRGVDVVLDMVGGDYVNRNLALLAPGGRLVQIAFLQGAKVEVNLGPLLTRNISIHGTTLRGQPAQKKAEIMRNLLQTVWPALADGGIKALIDSEFPLPEAEKAHKRMENNLNIGKIVLKV